jgi:threonyl-tRNA synthetase
MIHRALLGSLERFFGVLIEHYAGAFPLWLAPTQAVVIPVAERHQEYANSVADCLRKKGVRVHVDDRSEKMGYKIREAQVQKVPYMLVVGDKEVEARNVAVRHRQAGDLGVRGVDELASQILRLAGERATTEEAPPAAGASAGGVK